MRRRTWVVGIGSMAMALAVSACGGGVSAETTAFCEDYADAGTMVSNGPSEDVEAWAGEVTTSLNEIVDTAPSELEEPIGVIAGAILPAVEAGDPEALFAGTETPEFAEAEAAVDEFLKAECGWDVVDVVATEYQYDAELADLQAGYTGFAFQNNGGEVHEMVLVRLNDDTTESIEELLALPEEEALSKVSFEGIAFSMPGEGDSLFVDLRPGQYAFFCFLPVGSTPDMMEQLEAGELEGPPHFTEGMIGEFTVEG